MSATTARPLRVALTGGIGTGKSYCLERFRALGAPVIDADDLARQAVSPGSAGLRAVVSRFGADSVREDGTLNRDRLAARVFSDPDARRDLEAIVHPIVYRAIAEWFDHLPASSPPAIADIPLLYETRREGDFDRVVVASCPVEMQIDRLTRRDGMSVGDAELRVASQWPIGEKAKRADFVIDTSGTFEDTDRQVDVVWRALSTGVSGDLRRR